MKNGGIMDDISIVAAITAIVFAGYFLFKVMAKDEKNQELNTSKVKEMQNELHSMADQIKSITDKNREQQAEINQLVSKQIALVKLSKENSDDIDETQDHISRAVKSINKIDHSPRYVTLIPDPKRPLEVKVIRTPAKRKKTVTRRKTKKTSTGVVSISESNEVPFKGKVTDFDHVKQVKRKVKKKTTRKPSSRSKSR